MNRDFQQILAALIQPRRYGLHCDYRRSVGIGATLNNNRLERIAGVSSTSPTAAQQPDDTIASMLQFFTRSEREIAAEIDTATARDSGLATRLRRLATDLRNGAFPGSQQEQINRFWQVFFPEGLIGTGDDAIEALRRRRRVTVTESNPHPIRDPGTQMLFTSNALLTVPAVTADNAAHTDSAHDIAGIDLYARAAVVASEPQRYWYDHPIPIGVPAANNEIIYGLRALDQAIVFERRRTAPPPDKTPCLLSVSVTHRGLGAIARDWLRHAVQEANISFDCLEPFAVTEDDCLRLRREVLIPAQQRWLPNADCDDFSVFGVDGAYGRHYSFLKAIAPLWKLAINANLSATFKIDLDQVFPQDELVAQTGCSAFEHFTTPLWGGRGIDADGQRVELGMIAGALVNERDIDRGLFTPDVGFPDHHDSLRDWLFCSRMPQALSTRAEMMTNYGMPGHPDGSTSCLQRVHITGGTNGVLLDLLQRHRPFTPSFFGRAEDQAWLLSMLNGEHSDAVPRPAYLHASGLIMRHDKEAFAQDAIQRAKMDTIVGDFIRILHFSAYAEALDGGHAAVKRLLDPFTGAFVSPLPVTMACLGFLLKAAELSAADAPATADAPAIAAHSAPATAAHSAPARNSEAFLVRGTQRLSETLDFCAADHGSTSPFVRTVERERSAWNCYYELVDILTERATTDAFAERMIERIAAILGDCRV